MRSIDAVAVAAGPGSFTGLRIGSATAKGLGLALEKPLIPVPTLEGLAYNLCGVGGLVCPIMDARRGQVYTGILPVPGRRIPDGWWKTRWRSVLRNWAKAESIQRRSDVPGGRCAGLPGGTGRHRS